MVSDYFSDPVSSVVEEREEFRLLARIVQAMEDVDFFALGYRVSNFIAKKSSSLRHAEDFGDSEVHQLKKES